MSFLIFVLAVAALIVALKALRDSQPRPGQPTPAERIAGLEERVRDLLYRVWTLEQQRSGAPAQPEAPPAPMAPVPTEPAPSAHEPVPSPAWSAAAVPPTSTVPGTRYCRWRSAASSRSQSGSASMGAMTGALCHVADAGGAPVALRGLLGYGAEVIRFPPIKLEDVLTSSNSSTRR